MHLRPGQAHRGLALPGLATARRALARHPGAGAATPLAEPRRGATAGRDRRRVAGMVAQRPLVRAAARPPGSAPRPAALPARSATARAAAGAARRPLADLGALLGGVHREAPPAGLAPEPSAVAGRPGAARPAVAGPRAPERAGAGRSGLAPGADHQLADRRGGRRAPRPPQPGSAGRHPAAVAGRNHPAQPRRSARQGSRGGRRRADRRQPGRLRQPAEQGRTDPARRPRAAAPR
ncbi:hypothetical protein D9M68_177060 [compost metagenome]